MSFFVIQGQINSNMNCSIWLNLQSVISHQMCLSLAADGQYMDRQLYQSSASNCLMRLSLSADGRSMNGQCQPILDAESFDVTAGHR